MSDDIIVNGRRTSSDEEIDWSELTAQFRFDFSWLSDWASTAGGGGGQSDAPEEQPPENEENPEEETEIVVVGIRPSRGQENFADDGDVFNDGQPPTYFTVWAWLEQMYLKGFVDTYSIFYKDSGDASKGYTGSYVTIDGRGYEFESDGKTASNFKRYETVPQPLYDDLPLL